MNTIDRQPDLIVFGEDWGGLPSTTQKLISSMPADRKVLWVNSIGLRQPRFSLRDMKRVFSKIARKLDKDAVSGMAVPGHFHVLNPITVPAPRSHFARELAKRLLKRQVLASCEALGIDSPALWISLPTAVDLVGELNECTSTYYCCDDFASLAGVDHDTVSAREAELVDKADRIIAVNDELASRFPAEKVMVLTHGVDTQLFTSPALRADDLPRDGRPIAGFYGSLSEWIDIDMIAKTARVLPGWNFVIIGEACVDISELEALPNVYLLGARPHHELPRYSQHWSVSMLPFRNNRQIQACNPMKLSEYLAAGSPIVSIDFPAIAPYKRYIDIIEEHGSMAQALLAARHRGDAICRTTSVASLDWTHQAARAEGWMMS